MKKVSLALVMVAAMMIAACSNSGAPVTNKEQNTAKQADKVEPVAITRIINTVMGEVEVPTEPQRVVVDWDLGHIVALGIEPVGASKTTLDFGLLLKQFITDKTEEIGRDGQVSYEKVLELNPDLIITWNREQVSEYAKIAPTVVFETKKYANMHEQLRGMGEILNRQAEADKWLAEFDERIAKAKEKIKEAIPSGATFSIIDAATLKDAIVVGEATERGGLAAYQALGLTPQEKVKTELIDKGESRAEVSWEAINQFAGDYIFLITQGEDVKPELPSTWNSLEAVKNGNVMELYMKEFFVGDPVSTLYQAEIMADKIVAVAKEKK
ncbi:ABC transporter substrate-binding protein [Paenibacillus yanchengensis]|uniref:ABC transporter substrate-binding protein n=1 Tax=Paenibacillus yanchengensis TaxID=2035833 RepID=A0ABW4YNL0_9BACL